MDIAKACYGYSLRILLRRDFTEQQMRTKLRERYIKIFSQTLAEPNLLELKKSKQQKIDIIDSIVGVASVDELDSDTGEATKSAAVIERLTDIDNNSDTDSNAHFYHDRYEDSTAIEINEIEMNSVIDTIIDELTSLSYLDDQRFAQGFVHGQGKRYGEYRIRQGLKTRGITPNDDLFESLNSREVARGVARKYVNRSRRKPIEKIRSGLYSHLLYRGFSSEITREVIAIVLSDFQDLKLEVEDDRYG